MIKQVTITENKLSVTDPIPFSGFKKGDVVTIAALASQEEGMAVIDLAVIEYAKTMGADFNAYKQISYTPFDPSIKRAEATIETKGKRFRTIKGAPR